MFAGESEDDSSLDQLRAFLALDSARFIAELSLGPTPYEDELGCAIVRSPTTSHAC